MKWQHCLTDLGLVTPYGDIVGSIIPQLLVCCLTAPEPILLAIGGILCHSLESNSIASAKTQIQYNEYESYIFGIITTSPFY